MAELESACARLLDACEERMVDAGPEGCRYDHPASEARLVVAGALEASEREGDAALWLVRVATETLAGTPLGAPSGAFQGRFRRALRESGVPVPNWLRLAV